MEKILLTVDVVIFARRGHDLEVLLIQRKNPPFDGYWALPGGFVDEGEPVGKAALRELEEETGLKDIPVEQLRTFGDPGRDPRGRTVSVAHLALLPEDYDHLVVQAGDDASDARWFPITATPPLAFDHAEILECAIKRLFEGESPLLPRTL